MSLRSKALALVEVLLRVPPLFVVDEFLKISLGLPVSSGEEVTILSNITVDSFDVTDSEANYYDANFYNAFFFTLLKFLVCCIGKQLIFSGTGVATFSWKIYYPTLRFSFETFRTLSCHYV